MGPYYKTGFKATSLFAEERYVRAWYGGTGCYKIGGYSIQKYTLHFCKFLIRNYAPTILPQMKAAKIGCQQNLWLQGEDLALTEVGSMNIFVFWENENGGMILFVFYLIIHFL